VLNPLEASARLAARALDDLRNASGTARGWGGDVRDQFGALGARAEQMQRQINAGLEVLRDIRRLARGGVGALDRLEAQAGRVIELGERLDSRAESILGLGERLDARAESILAVGQRLDARAESILALGERIDVRAVSILEFGEGFEDLGREIKDEAHLVHTRAAEIIEQADEVKPMLTRAIGLVEPLQGTVDRLGRVVDRLPGGRAAGRRKPSTEQPT
jgi:methyl-accepting chemotaxis protein